MLAVPHLIPDTDTAGIVARLAAVLAPGKLVVISDVTSDFATAAR